MHLLLGACGSQRYHARIYPMMKGMIIFSEQRLRGLSMICCPTLLHSMHAPGNLQPGLVGTLYVNVLPRKQYVKAQSFIIILN